MHLVELFRGTGSVGHVARRWGWEVVSVDMDPVHKATHTVDVRNLPYRSMRIPDVVWASPPCTTYSLAANRVHHRAAGGRALTQEVNDADAIVRHLLKMISYWLRQNPNLVYCIENPRGYLRSLPDMMVLPHLTTTFYGHYGWPIHKPTDFWSNTPLVLPQHRPDHPPLVHVGSTPGWRRKLREAMGARPDEPQAVLLGRIPPRLIRSILKQLVDASDRSSPDAQSRRSRQGL